MHTPTPPRTAGAAPPSRQDAYPLHAQADGGRRMFLVLATAATICHHTTCPSPPSDRFGRKTPSYATPSSIPRCRFPHVAAFLPYHGVSRPHLHPRPTTLYTRRFAARSRFPFPCLLYVHIVPCRADLFTLCKLPYYSFTYLLLPVPEQGHAGTLPSPVTVDFLRTPRKLNTPERRTAFCAGTRAYPHRCIFSPPRCQAARFPFSLRGCAPSVVAC